MEMEMNRPRGVETIDGSSSAKGEDEKTTIQN